MLQARRLIFALSVGISIWVLGSFAGTMVDPAHSGFWTASLMWALLTSLLLSPALLVAAHHVSRDDPSGTGGGGRGSSFTDEPPQIWPEPEEPPEEPVQDEPSREGWPWNRDEVDSAE
jgi:hypothetical protein